MIIGSAIMDLVLQATAVEVAREEVERGVREESSNWSPRIAEYIRNLDPPLDFPIPYCAAFVQFCTDMAAQTLRLENPLDQVKREAYVADYWAWARDHNLVVPDLELVRPGDLIVFSFGGTRKDHIGFVETPGSPAVTTLEANTSPGDEGSQRDGQGVHRKLRSVYGPGVEFIRWGPLALESE